MRSTLTLVLALSFCGSIRSETMGCAGAFLHTNYNTYNAPHYQDSLELCDGTIDTIYATFESCCAALLGANIPVVWFRNGQALDTTSLMVVHNNIWYTHALVITQPGIYKATFLGFGINTANASQVIAFCPSPLAPPASSSSNDPITQTFLELNQVSQEDNSTLKWVVTSGTAGTMVFELFTLGGTRICCQTFPVTEGANEMRCDLPSHSEGLFILLASMNSDRVNRKIFLK